VSEGGGGIIQETRCFGSHGLYAPKWGLLPTCDVEALTAELVEVTPDREYCPDPK